MVVSQTPLRISLFGGGTDFPDYYKNYGGAVLSFGIDKYIYVIAKDRFDSDIYVNYSKKEIVKCLDDLEHELVREAMRKAQIFSGVEITTLADIPSEGSGLGSSSSVTVGLLHALYAHRNIKVTAEKLASEACEIEIDILSKPIGIQDQNIAAHGGICFFQFQKNGNVIVEKIELSSEIKRELSENLLLFYTNRTRKSETILINQKNNINHKYKELNRLNKLAFDAREALFSGNINKIGLLLHESWQIKKGLSTGISNSEIDTMYQMALNAGAIGGKISGAGGGGFLLLYCPLSNQKRVREALNNYKELEFRLGRDGSKIVFNINI